MKEQVLEINNEQKTIESSTKKRSYYKNFDERLEEYYQYLLQFNHQPSKDICFKDGCHMYNWRTGCRFEIKRMALNGDSKAQFVLNSLNNNRISFDQKCLEIIDYIKNHLEIPAINSEVRFSNGSKIGLWLGESKKTIIQRHLLGNTYATLLIHIVLELQPDFFGYLYHQIPKQELSETIAPSIKKKDCYKNFDERLEEYYQYLLQFNHHPSRDICFKDGCHMYNWRTSFHFEIKRKALNGNSKAQLVLNYSNNNKLSFDQKCLEIINYIKNHLEIPTVNSEVRFSNGSKMGLWLIKSRKAIIQCHLLGRVHATALIHLALEVQPDFFDHLQHQSSNQELRKLKTNYQFVKRK